MHAMDQLLEKLTSIQISANRMLRLHIWNNCVLVNYYLLTAT